MTAKLAPSVTTLASRSDRAASISGPDISRQRICEIAERKGA
jgi:hypothetical protein